MARLMTLTDITIRLAREDDDALLGELQVAAYLAQYAGKRPHLMPGAQRLANLRDQAGRRLNGTVLVGERGGKIFGSVTLYRWGNPRTEAWIEGAADVRMLAVAPAFHGQGLSGALMDAGEAQAREWRASAVCPHARDGCDGVARLYMARGYRRDPAGDFAPMPNVALEGYVLPLS